jgi:rhodanese-related sulfurtransferase
MKHSPGFLALVDAARARVRECTAADVKARLDRGERFHFVDVREDSEFAVDRAAGARHMGRGVIERDIESLIPDHDAPIVLYCGGGYRSALAADNLRQMGYHNVWSMDGGIRAWREAGYPIERGAA